jgi:hypothetical protein
MRYQIEFNKILIGNPYSYVFVHKTYIQDNQLEMRDTKFHLKKNTILFFDQVLKMFVFLFHFGMPVSTFPRPTPSLLVCKRLFQQHYLVGGRIPKNL